MRSSSGRVQKDGWASGESIGAVIRTPSLGGSRPTYPPPPAVPNWPNPRSVPAQARHACSGAHRSRELLAVRRSEEHTSELQSLMRISYAVFCLKKKNMKKHTTQPNHPT